MTPQKRKEQILEFTGTVIMFECIWAISLILITILRTGAGGNFIELFFSSSNLFVYIIVAILIFIGMVALSLFISPEIWIRDDDQ